jgi:hypothetical protein
VIRSGMVGRRECFSLLVAGSLCGLVAASVVEMLFAGVVEVLRRWVLMQHVTRFELVVVGLSSRPNRESRTAAGMKSGFGVVQAAVAAKEFCRA